MSESHLQGRQTPQPPPPDQAAPATGYAHPIALRASKPPLLAAQITVGALTAYSLVHLVLLWNRWTAIAAFERLQSGALVSDLDKAQIGARSYYFGLAHGLLALLSMVSVIAWLYVARNNAEGYRNLRFRQGRGWTIGAWFCPGVNLWFPYQCVSDVVAASDPVRGPGHADKIGKQGVVVVWWTAFLAMLATTIASGLLRPSAHNIGSAKREVVTDALLMPFWLAAATALIFVVMNVTNDQKARYRRGIDTYGMP